MAGQWLGTPRMSTLRRQRQSDLPAGGQPGLRVSSTTAKKKKKEEDKTKTREKERGRKRERERERGKRKTRKKERAKDWRKYATEPREANAEVTKP